MADFTNTATDKLTASDILSIAETAPELLFKPDETDIKTRFRQLSMLWHPDKRPGDAEAANVFERVTRLKDIANERFKAGTWKVPGEMLLTDVATGKKFKVKYTKQRDFELGEMYISEGHVTYALRKENKDLFENARRAISGLTFADGKMKDEFTRCLPEIKSVIETPDRYVMVVRKDPKLVLLADVLDHYGGKIDAKHVAWIESSLHNVACFLAYNNVAHNALALDTYFIDPEGHTGALLGGWWYAAKAGAALTGLPSETVRVVHPDVLATGRADPRVDLILLRNVGRTLLGDKIGMKLGRDKDVPKALADWLTLPPNENAFEDYKKWMGKILPDSFGVRRYVKMDVTYRDIYKP